MISSTSRLDPVLPEPLPSSITSSADQLTTLSQRLSAQLSSVTAARLADIFCITHAYHSNQIEGHYADVALMEDAFKTGLDHSRYKNLSVRHMQAERSLLRFVTELPTNAFADTFDPNLIARIHLELFAYEASQMVPGRIRSAEHEQVQIGSHIAPQAALVLPMLQHLKNQYGRVLEPRKRLITVLANHHRLALIHPFLDGNGRVSRMQTHLQLAFLGLLPEAWSLCRGLAKRRDDYYRCLALADRPREGDYDGRGQLSRRYFFGFIEFMIDVCLEQVQYVLDALSPTYLSQRISKALSTKEFRNNSISPSSAYAVTELIKQGSMPIDALKLLLNQGEHANEELKKLTKSGIVKLASATPDVEIAFPLIFAEIIFPELHADA